MDYLHHLTSSSSIRLARTILREFFVIYVSKSTNMGEQGKSKCFLQPVNSHYFPLSPFHLSLVALQTYSVCTISFELLSSTQLFFMCNFFHFFLFSQLVSELISLKTAKATADVLVSERFFIFFFYNLEVNFFIKIIQFMFIVYRDRTNKCC